MGYADLCFSQDELDLICLKTVDGVVQWSCSGLVGVRGKVRVFHRGIQRDLCCYCRKDFADDHPLAVDVEHILPRSVYPEFCVHVVNFSVSCKRCNMGIKRDRVDFISGLAPIGPGEICDSSRYLIIHPNLDVYRDHLRVRVSQDDDLIYRKYAVVNESAKGSFTYNYFRLFDLERADIDSMQGIAVSDSPIESILNEIQGL